jgi:riboflavin-specific deaminase-like protein
LYALRATADAVMCGARTAEMDGLQLGPGPARYRRLRRQRGLAEYNLRVLVSGAGSINPRASIFTRRFSPILILTTERVGARRLAALRKVADAVLVFGVRAVDFTAALAELRVRWGVERLLCEGGGELNSALFAAGVADELHLTICPLVFGGRDAPSLADGLGVTRLAEAARLELRSCQRHGDELFCVFAAAGRARGS